MRKFLQKLAWKTHRWETKFSLLNLYFGDDGDKFGIELLSIENGIKWKGSFFEFTWSFPTVTHRGILRVDVFFLYNKWSEWCIDLEDRKLWGRNLNLWEKINLHVHSKFSSIG